MTQEIVIVDYEAGNLTSVQRAVESLGYVGFITPNPEIVAWAQKIIFPGVGAAPAAMNTLKRRGLDRALKEAFNKGTPILGICIGCQVIMDTSDEGDAQCLGLIEGRVKRFPSPLLQNGQKLKVPHMGWNSIEKVKAHPVLADISPLAEFYFVHSYFPVPADEKNIVAKTEHGIEFPSVVARKNLVALQFHTEKSGRPGLKILKNFIAWDGKYAL